MSDKENLEQLLVKTQARLDALPMRHSGRAPLFAKMAYYMIQLGQSEAASFVLERGIKETLPNHPTYPLLVKHLAKLKNPVAVPVINTLHVELKLPLLPIEIWLEIWSWLKLPELCKLYCVSKHFKSILDANPRVWQLDFTGITKKVTNKQLKWLAERVKGSIRHLIIPDASKLTDSVAKSVKSQRLNALESLCLYDAYQLNQQGLNQMFQCSKITQLTRLELGSFSKTNNIDLAFVLKSCSHSLKHLVLDSMPATLSMGVFIDDHSCLFQSLNPLYSCIITGRITCALESSVELLY